MKKIISVVLALLIFSMVLKFFVSSYNINYKIDGYKVLEKYKDGYIYFEIDSKYNFVLEAKRKINKKLINKITKVGSENEFCIYPKIKGLTTYPLCESNGVMTSYYLINDTEVVNFVNSLKIKEEENTTKETFKFFNNLEKNEYIAVYKYDGFYILNGNKIKSVNIFDKDRYDNSLCEQISNYIVLPAESEFNYNELIVIDLLTGKTSTIKSDYEISFDSTILGHLKNSIYILDNKNNIQYEVNLKKKEVTLIGNSEIGYKVYKDGKLKTGMISELKSKEKWNDESKENIYTYNTLDSSITSNIKFNDTLTTTVYNTNGAVLGSYKDNLFILDKDSIYKITPLKGPKKILLYEELNYNKNNTIFIYNNK